MTGSDMPPSRPTPARPREPGSGQGAITVTVWHNLTRDAAGRHTGYDGFTPGDQMVKVFAYHTQVRGRGPEEIAEAAYAAFNGFPADGEAGVLARRYAARRLRSVSKGDLIIVGEVALTVESAGFARLRGGFTPERAHEHGTHPL